MRQQLQGEDYVGDYDMMVEAITCQRSLSKLMWRQPVRSPSVVCVLELRFLASIFHHRIDEVLMNNHVIFSGASNTNSL